ncbi:hypothetical protein ACFOYU_11225 [Microvirga sp. GCM10011540]|uniref:hypothetical protein n=1 Tax=Microvirga sp. GCM10011540 TaxID=3317338 RepID=UPI003615D5B0
MTLFLNPIMMGKAGGLIKDPPVFVSASSAWSGSTLGSATTTVDKPANIQSGDLLIAYAFTSSGSFSSVPTDGWTVIENGAYWIAYKLAGNNEPATWAFQNSTSGTYEAAVIIAYRGAKPPIFGTRAGANGYGPLTIPAITTTVPNTRVLAIGTLRENSTTDRSISAFWSSNVTPVYSGPNNWDAYLAERLMEEPGDTGTSAIQANTSLVDVITGVLVALEPA